MPSRALGFAREARSLRLRSGLAGRRPLFWVGLGVRVAGGPVFGWEGDVPEVGIGEEKLDANFNLLVGKFVNVGDDALERVFGLRIRQGEALAAIHRGADGKQRAVSADRQGEGFFF